MNGQQTGPSRAYYGVAGAILVGGWILFGWFLLRSLDKLPGRLWQVVVPGKTDITLAKAGSYTIYHEYRSVIGSRSFSSPRVVSGLECRLVSAATGAEIPLSTPLGSSNYSLGNRAGVALFEFDIDQPGVYEISGGYVDTGEGPQVVLAIGQGFVGAILLTVFGCLAIAFGCVGISAAIAVFTAVKRRKARERAHEPYAI